MLDFYAATNCYVDPADIPRMSIARYAHASVTVGPHIYVMGGVGSNGKVQYCKSSIIVGCLCRFLPNDGGLIFVFFFISIAIVLSV